MLQVYTVDGIQITSGERRAILSRVRALHAENNSAIVVTVSSAYYSLAEKSYDFKRTLTTSALNLIDGVGVAWAIRRKTHSRVETYPGIDLLQDIVGLGASIGWRIGFIGGRPGSARSARQRLLKRFPKAQIWCSSRDYYQVDASRISLCHDLKLLAELRAAELDVVFVGLGAPLQELWLSANLRMTGARVGIGVGGSFDVIGGMIPRAPLWMRNLGLEWLYRTARQPTRVVRIPALIGFAIRCVVRNHVSPGDVVFDSEATK